MSDAVALCCLCSGPIGRGEPVVVLDGKLAHRFKITCEQCREDQEIADREFLAAMKIS
jgi:hypothetical protein